MNCRLINFITAFFLLRLSLIPETDGRVFSSIDDDNLVLVEDLSFGMKHIEVR